MVNVSTAVPTYVAAVCRAVLEANRMGTLAAVRAVALAETHDRAGICWWQVNWIARRLVSR
jgi:hypothetical protein